MGCGQNLKNDRMSREDWAKREKDFKSGLLKGRDEDGIRTHACRSHWISSPTPLKGEFHGSAHARILTGLCMLSGTGPDFSLFMNQS